MGKVLKFKNITVEFPSEPDLSTVILPPGGSIDLAEEKLSTDQAVKTVSNMLSDIFTMEDMAEIRKELSEDK